MHCSRGGPARPEQPLSRHWRPHDSRGVKKKEKKEAVLMRVNAACTAVLLHISSEKYARMVKAIDDFAPRRTQPALFPSTAFCDGQRCCVQASQKWRKLCQKSAIIIIFVSRGVNIPLKTRHRWPHYITSAPCVCFVTVKSWISFDMAGRSGVASTAVCLVANCPRLRPPSWNQSVFPNRIAVPESSSRTCTRTQLCKKPVSETQWASENHWQWR